MIVLDASVLIGYLDAADAHHELATALLTREVDDDLAVNILTVAEQADVVAQPRLGDGPLEERSVLTVAHQQQRRPR